MFFIFVMLFCGDVDLFVQVDVVVIGGGIVGVIMVLELVECGILVVLCEKGVIVGEQFSCNWGWMWQMGCDEWELLLCMYLVEMWLQMNVCIGCEIGWWCMGICYLFYNQCDLWGWQVWEQIGCCYGLDVWMLFVVEIVDKLFGQNGGMLGVLYMVLDGWVELWIVVFVMVEVVCDKGVVIVIGCVVCVVEILVGCISGVVIECGVVCCQMVVVVGGIWLWLFLCNMGLDFLQLKLIGLVVCVDGVEGLIDMLVGVGDFVYCKCLDGGFIVVVCNKNFVLLMLDYFCLLIEFLLIFLILWCEFSLWVNGSFVQDLLCCWFWQFDQMILFEVVWVMDFVFYFGFVW